MTLKHKQGYGEMAFGENLKRLRQDKGYTQVQLAKQAGLRVASVSQMERNEGDPKLSTIYKLMDSLECSADSLLLDLKHESLSKAMKTMLERAEKLPEREKRIVLDVIDTYCVSNGLNEVVEKGWKKFTIVTEESLRNSRIKDDIE